MLIVLDTHSSYIYVCVIQCENMFLLSDDSWEVRETPFKGKGVFVTKQIEKGTVIGDYLGTVIQMSEYDIEEDSRGLYLMYLTDEFCIYPDLKKPGLHFINHSCKPNCWMYTYDFHTLFFALRTIQSGEELCISYLLSPMDSTCDPCTHICYCKEQSCTGTMHLSQTQFILWQEFQKKRQQIIGKIHHTVNSPLQRLKNYPSTISVDSIYEQIISMNTT